MSQVTTGELSAIVAVLVTTELSVIGFFVKRMFFNIDKKLESISKAQHQCQATLFEKYVSRIEWDHFMERGFDVVTKSHNGKEVGRINS